MKRPSSRPETDCPCGSGRRLSDCCGPYLEDRDRPHTAEALMRSRYSAYALGHEDYLLRTWHPATCPDRLGLEDGAPVRWLGLKILATRGGGPGDCEGMVEFVARYKVGGRATRLHERSAFERVDGKWLYVGAEMDR